MSAISAKRERKTGNRESKTYRMTLGAIGMIEAIAHATATDCTEVVHRQVEAGWCLSEKIVDRVRQELIRLGVSRDESAPHRVAAVNGGAIAIREECVAVVVLESPVQRGFYDGDELAIALAGLGSASLEPGASNNVWDAVAGCAIG